MMKRYFGLVIAAFVLSACDDEVGRSDYFDTINSQQSASAPVSQPVPAPQNSPDDTFVTDGSEYLQSLETPTDVVADPTDTAVAPVVKLNEPALTAPTVTEKQTKRAAKVKAEPVSNAVTPIANRSSTIDLAAYGRSQQHLVGEKKYSRNTSKYDAGGSCGNYTVPEIAQTVFLDAGGPRKDPLLLDRDGDGFACAWAPNR